LQRQGEAVKQMIEKHQIEGKKSNKEIRHHPAQELHEKAACSLFSFCRLFLGSRVSQRSLPRMSPRSYWGEIMFAFI
jgi:hypothetical protein